MGNSDSKLQLSFSLEQLFTDVEGAATDPIKLLGSAYQLEDIYEILPPRIVRDLRKHNPVKVHALIKLLVDFTLDMFTKSLDVPMAVDSDRRMLGNAIRLLTRVMPFINDDNSADEFSELLWDSKSPPKSIDDASPDSLGFRLIAALFRASFIRGYTLPPLCNAPELSSDPNRVDSNIVWGSVGGIGGVPLYPRRTSVAPAVLEARIEVIRCFITVLSSPLFQSMTEYQSRTPSFNRLTVSGDFLHTSNFFVSLLNSVLDYDPSRSYFALDSDSPEERLASTSLDLINILLDVDSVGDDDVNVFREIFNSGISEDLPFITSALRDKLTAVYAPPSRLGLASPTPIRSESGFVLFLFNLLLTSSPDNTLVIPHITTNCGKELVLAMLKVIIVSLPLPTGVGLVHTASFVLLQLSGDRQFALDILSKPYLGELNSFLPAPDRPADNVKMSDVLITTLFKQSLFRSKFVAESLAEMWYTIGANISPFVTLAVDTANVTVLTADKLTRPAWVDRRRSLDIVKETIDRALQYQYEGSVHLVYSLLLRRDCIGVRTETTERVMEYVAPRVEEECRSREGEIDHLQVMQQIRRISVVGILPPAPPIVIRHYQQNPQTQLWFTSFLWGVVFSNLQSMPVFDWHRVKMITLSFTPGNDTDEEAWGDDDPVQLSPSGEGGVAPPTPTDRSGRQRRISVSTGKPVQVIRA